MEDRMVELTRFVQVSEAEILANLLQSEGIDCYVRDGFISDVYKGVVDLGGAKVELLEKDVQRAMEVMKAYGYGAETEETGIPDEIRQDEDSGDDDIMEDMSQSVMDENAQSKAKLSKVMVIFTVIILLVLGCIIVMNKYFNG